MYSYFFLGNGFYLYTSDEIDTKNSIQCENNITIEETEDSDNVEGGSIDDDTPVQVIIVSLWYWW